MAAQTDAVFAGSGMTFAELAQLPVTLNVSTAARALGIGADKAYALIRSGTFPVKVLELGATTRVPTMAVLRALGAEAIAAPALGEAQSLS
ncbi:DNA-binding protein [Embleya sp. NPDC059237]|uniref:DNA-binding protein n=1 Tax=Embleya sp. NPDC059237 TaxID=3346784 RepID=UPI0036A0C30E